MSAAPSRLGSETSASDTLAAVEIAKKDRFIDVKDCISLAVLRQREHRLSGLYDLADLQTARGNHARRFGTQCGIAKSVRWLNPAAPWRLRAHLPQFAILPAPGHRPVGW